mmetsp:Transcript_114757/g.370850  ORF Transcript_114757/g.370850 Transcript_114757/m.370850 type:complete len:243 (+) Transcript_114757:757-1485(+)
MGEVSPTGMFWFTFSTSHCAWAVSPMRTRHALSGLPLTGRTLTLTTMPYWEKMLLTESSEQSMGRPQTYRLSDGGGMFAHAASPLCTHPPDFVPPPLACQLPVASGAAAGMVMASRAASGAGAAAGMAATAGTDAEAAAVAAAAAAAAACSGPATAPTHILAVARFAAASQSSSKVTKPPMASDCPSMSTLRCTRTSSTPSFGTTRPVPLASSHNLTVPVTMLPTAGPPPCMASMADTAERP